jgi:hypothetical protein
MDAATAALKNCVARDSWTCYEIKTSDEQPLPNHKQVCNQFIEPQQWWCFLLWSNSAFCQRKCKFWMEIINLINVVSFHFGIL